jgi:1-acyl-sn-glycerol-3-phosphate acyltransferase
MLKKVRASTRLLLFMIIILALLGSVMLVALISAPHSRRKKRVARVMQGYLKLMVALCGLRVEVYGARPSGSRPFLLLSNHVSYWDILVLGSMFPLGFMAKDSIAHWPLLGTVIRLCNTIFVNRENVRDRCRALRSLQAEIRDMSYCVFPEGTTTAAAVPQFSQWRRGNVAVLREPGVEVWLAGLHYEKHEEEAWVDDDALLPHLFMRLQEARIRITVHFKMLAWEPGMPLAAAAENAWQQTAGLCQKAQYDWDRTAAARTVQLCKTEDSAVS